MQLYDGNSFAFPTGVVYNNEKCLKILEGDEMSEYYLMNKNRRRMRFRVYMDEITGEYTCESLETCVEENVFPPKFSDIFTWINDRNYAKHKEHLRKWLKEMIM